MAVSRPTLQGHRSAGGLGHQRVRGLLPVLGAVLALVCTFSGLPAAFRGPPHRPGRYVHRKFLLARPQLAPTGSQASRCRSCSTSALPSGAPAVAVSAVALLGAAAWVLLQGGGETKQQDKAEQAEAVGEGGKVKTPRGTAAAERPSLPPELVEALEDFEGDFRGPWLALGLDPDVDWEASADELRAAYRTAVRKEHPDTSDEPDAEARFNRVRKAFALLSDDGLRELLLEAMERDVERLEELAPEGEESEEGTGPALRVAIVLGLLVGAGGAWLRLGAEGQLRFTAKRQREEDLAAAKAAAASMQALGGPSE